MDMTMTTEALFDTKGVTVAYLNPTPRLTRAAWRCAEYDDPDVFSPTDEDQLLQAQEVCGGCAVRELCLELGVSRDEWGVWGGVLLEGGKPLARVKRPGRPRKESA